MQFQFNDGGRAAAGFKGRAGDCVARSVAIASGMPYADVYAALAQGMGSQRSGKRGKSGKQVASARNGITTSRKWFKNLMVQWGFKWVPTMAIGSGCKVHLVDGELPGGRLVVAVSKHYTAVIDGVIHDTDDPQRNVHYEYGDGSTKVVSRCVYGYWVFEQESHS